jgi:hypothetical protein
MSGDFFRDTLSPHDQERECTENKQREHSVDDVLVLTFIIIVELCTDMSLHFLTISSSPVRPYFLQPHSGSHRANSA